MRAFAAIIFLMLATATAARAGDAAELDILGFSADGGVFAFEEFGVADGSGFPYANRYYIDTHTDKFVANTPVRVMLENDGATIEQARSKARQQGEAILPQGILDSNRGFTAGSNAITEYSADPYRMLVNPRPVFPPADDRLEFRLEEIALSAPNCDGMGTINGFRLLRIGAEAGQSTTLLHEDTTIPQSRGCPNGYRIGAVQIFGGQQGPSAYALLIAVRRYGFEGPDHRWIAVTGRL